MVVFLDARPPGGALMADRASDRDPAAPANGGRIPAAPVPAAPYVSYAA